VSRLGLLIPARNAARTIGRLLGSAQRDNTFDEILVHDDASTDDTAAVASRQGAVVMRDDSRVGSSTGKNRLADRSTCDWVHFHDADGELAGGFSDRARRWIDEVRCDVVLFATEDRDDATGAHLGSTRWDETALQNDPVRFHIAHTVTNCGVYRRRAFLAAGGFDEDPAVRNNEGQAMHLRLALAGLSHRADAHVGAIVHRRADSMPTGGPIACARAQVEVLSRIAEATGVRYCDAIGPRAWRLAAVCGSFKDWVAVDRCLHVAASVGYADPQHEHWLVRAVARLDGAAAVKFREATIRLVKPWLRNGTPVVASPIEEQGR
jgi:glycosyltransferase involved in cell wall biosynthesis